MYTTVFHKGDIDKTRFLVTGGAGFIGSNIVEYLIKYNAGMVRVLDNLSTGFKDNINPYLENTNFEFIKGDITYPNDCEKACEDIDYVIHQAALGSVPRSVNDPQATNHANVTGFLNILVSARNKGVKRIVYASSSSVYGDSPHLPKTEDQIGNPLSPYAVSKRVDELYAAVFVQNYQMEVIGLRYFNIFGPRQNPTGPYAAAIPIFMSAVLKNESPWINGDGEQSRDFTFVENAVEANIRSLYCDINNCNGGVFNIAVGERTTINQLFNMIRDEAQSELKPLYRQDRKGDVKHSLADISKAKQLIDYQGTFTIKEGLKITFNWFRNQYH